MERGDWESEGDYPGAPVPAHERSWRHPSEIGASQWVHTEPPLVVGRGLSVATGAVGVVLAVGLLWLMIPHQSRGGVAVEDSTTLARVGASSNLATRTLVDASVNTAVAPHPVITEAAVPAVATSVAATVAPPVAASIAATTTIVSSSAPVATHVRPTAPTTTPPPVVEDASSTTAPSASPSAAPAMAVALNDGHLVVTTAAAAKGRVDVPVQLSTGDVVDGAVVSIDMKAGTAVLALTSDIPGSAYQPSSAAMPAQAEIELSPQPAAATVWADETGTQITYSPGAKPAEGALVLDSNGNLMGMCTMSSSGVRLVGVSSMLNALDAATSQEAPGYLGIVLAGQADGGSLTVRNVFPDGPAAAAGIVPGDVITAVDATPVADLAALRAAVLTHQPGDQVVVSVLVPGAAGPTDVPVTLSQRPWSL
ncbi:MAG TPA: PDZ domain-containing protein [Ilumatobacteraceae bacterium]